VLIHPESVTTSDMSLALTPSPATAADIAANVGGPRISPAA
jgi:hypothetical protein